jgi:hypothetical protein
MKTCAECGQKLDHANKTGLCWYHHKGIGNLSHSTYPYWSRNRVFSSKSRGHGYIYREIYFKDLKARNPLYYEKLTNLIGYSPLNYWEKKGIQQFPPLRIK